MPSAVSEEDLGIVGRPKSCKGHSSALNKELFPEISANERKGLPREIQGWALIISKRSESIELGPEGVAEDGDGWHARGECSDPEE